MENAWSIGVVRAGYKFPLTQYKGNQIQLSPFPVSFPPPVDADRKEVLNEEVSALLEKGAIVQTEHVNAPGFYSRLFTVPKATGGFRPVLDLSPLNAFTPHTPFRMETVASVRQSIQPGDWAVSIDLKDAYFHVLIHPSRHHLLRFVWNNTCYHFCALPFGLALAPWIFTRLVRELVLIAHARGIRLLVYLDDWLMLAASREKCAAQADQLVSLTTELGFNIHPDKSELAPSQVFVYLGMVVDTVRFTVRPTDKRILELSNTINKLLNEGVASRRQLMSLLGAMESVSQLLPLARVYKRPLQRAMSRRFKHDAPLDVKVPLDGWFRSTVKQWQDQDWLASSVPIRPLGTTVYLHSDASKTGWGAHLLDHSVAGRWTVQEASLHINVLELEAIARALKLLAPRAPSSWITVCGDNTTALSYLRRAGGTTSAELSQKAEELLIWAHHQGLTLSVSFVPGRLNVLADQLSRPDQILPTEWTISLPVLRRIWTLWGTPDIDLFATSFNKRLPRYVSPILDHAAEARNAFAIPWTGLRAYAYPPISLIPLVLEKAARERPNLVLVAPWWEARSWFPQLVELADDFVHLHLAPTDITQPVSGAVHPDPAKLRLTAWKLFSTG